MKSQPLCARGDCRGQYKWNNDLSLKTLFSFAPLAESYELLNENEGLIKKCKEILTPLGIRGICDPTSNKQNLLISLDKEWGNTSYNHRSIYMTTEIPKLVVYDANDDFGECRWITLISDLLAQEEKMLYKILTSVQKEEFNPAILVDGENIRFVYSYSRHADYSTWVGQGLDTFLKELQDRITKK